MSRWVIGASVAAKWLLPEDGAAQTDALLGDAVHAPGLLPVEVANVLWEKTVRGETPPALARLAPQALARVPLRITASATLVQSALALAQQLGHPVYPTARAWCWPSRRRPCW